MILYVKKNELEAKVPQYAHPGDAGMDFFALENTLVPAGKIARVRTGISVEIPEGFVGLIWDKSGLSMNSGLKILGGVIDSGFRGEIIMGIINLGEKDYTFEKHHKIAQMLIQPINRLDIVEVPNLSYTVRGTDGFGSTGK